MLAGDDGTARSRSDENKIPQRAGNTCGTRKEIEMSRLAHNRDDVQAPLGPDLWRPKGSLYEAPNDKCEHAKAVMCFDRSDEIEARVRALELAMHQGRLREAKDIVSAMVNFFDSVACDFAAKGRV